MDKIYAKITKWPHAFLSKVWDNLVIFAYFSSKFAISDNV